MNKKFIKKNLFMIIFMTMALVAVIALVIMVFSVHKSMKEYDEKKKVFKKKPLHNWAAHGADAFQCLAMGYKEKTKPYKRPQSRGGRPNGWMGG